MDAIDVGLVRALSLRPHGPPISARALLPSSLAAALGIQPDTAKARLNRLRAQGILLGVEAYPNLTHLARKASAYMLKFAGDTEKRNALPGILAGCEVLELRDFLGGHLFVDFAYTGETHLTRQLDLLRAATGTEPAWYYDREMPRGAPAPTPLDWRIIKALRGDGRRRARDIADDLGVTARTVRRRRQLLSDAGSLYLVPRLDLSRTPGLLCCELLLRLREGGGPALMRKISETLQDHLLYAHVPTDGRVWNYSLLLAASTPAEIGGLSLRGLEIPEVERAEALFFRGTTDEGPWLDRLIGEKAA